MLEKRVKSRFSHRMWRVMSPLSPDALGWKQLLRRALIPWEYSVDLPGDSTKAVADWKGDWQFAIDVRATMNQSITADWQFLLDHVKIVKALDRLCSLTTDVRVLFRPFVSLPDQYDLRPV